MQFNKKNTSYKLCQYLEQGKPFIACIKSSDKENATILNASNKEFSISSKRIEFLPGRIPNQFKHNTQILAYLKGLTIESEKIKKSVNLETLWETHKNNQKEIRLENIQKSLFKNTNVANFLAIKWALLEDKYFFKKTKNGYLARKGNSIEEIKKLVEQENKKNEALNNWIKEIKNKEKELDPQCIKILEKTAAIGKKYEHSNVCKKILTSIAKDFNIDTNSKLKDQAFNLLVKLGLFSKHQNLIPIKLGRDLYFSEKDLNNARETVKKDFSDDRIDFTNLTSLTIDAEETTDYDDAISVEIMDSSYLVRIHISDVSSLVDPNSELWDLAKKRGASIYTPDSYNPMLPHLLSEKHFSLVKDEIRPAITISIKYNKDLVEEEFNIQKSLIKVSHRLSYNEVDSSIKNNESLDEINALIKIVDKLEANRVENGAKVLPKREMRPVINEQGLISIDKTDEDTPSRKIVSEMMILANYKVALFSRENKIPIYYRQQEKPSTLNLENIPEGPALEYAKRGTMKRSTISTSAGPHSGLGLECYAQFSSPIRRFPDLVNQSQVSNFLAKQEMLSTDILNSNIEKIDSTLGDVNYIQRSRHKYWLYAYLKQENIKTIDATVIKNENNRPIAELDGLILFSQFKKEKSQNIEIGQKIKLKIEQVKPKDNFLKLVQISE